VRSVLLYSVKVTGTVAALPAFIVSLAPSNWKVEPTVMLHVDVWAVSIWVWAPVCPVYR